MFKIATSCLGISSFDFWNMTPMEISLAFEGYSEKVKKDTELNIKAMKLAIINAKANKNYKLFKDEHEEKEIDPEEKKKQLDELKSLLG